MTEPSRRAVLQGVAWSIPIVAVAVATPAASASDEAITLVWAPGTVSYGQTVTLQMIVPTNSLYIGRTQARIVVEVESGNGAHIQSGSVSDPWIALFASPYDELRYFTRDPLSAGTYTFTLTFSEYSPGSRPGTYRAYLTTTAGISSSAARVTINTAQ